MVPAFGLVVRGRKINVNRRKMKPRQVHMKKIALVALIAVLSGCATVDGIGQDISGASRGIQSWF
jgi:predicted small secreted protein